MLPVAEKSGGRAFGGETARNLGRELLGVLATNLLLRLDEQLAFDLRERHGLERDGPRPSRTKYRPQREPEGGRDAGV